MSDHEEMESLVAAWVLGALDGDEAGSLRAHVDGCATCRETVARLRRVVGVMPLAVDEVAPPARLRERVLAAAAASGGSSPAPVQVRTRSAVRQGRRPIRLSLAGRVPAYAVAAAVVAALALGVIAGQLTSRGTPAPSTSQVARFTLTGHDSLSGARANVIDLKSDGVALVDFNGLPTLPQGRVYEVWLITAGGRADAAGVFVPDGNGGKVVLVNHSLDGYKLMAITDEAAPDGSLQPTQQPQLYGNVA